VIPQESCRSSVVAMYTAVFAILFYREGTRKIIFHVRWNVYLRKRLQASKVGSLSVAIGEWAV
jgi:hypothetical protein